MGRFDIADRKGLEIALLTTLLTIQDMAAANNAPADPVVLAPPVQPEAPPSPPPRPAPKTGINRIAEMHALRYEPNEVTVNEEGSIEDYGEYAEGLLAVRLVCVFLCSRSESPHGTVCLCTQDDAMLFITVRSASPADVARVLQVVEQVTRLRHKRGTCLVLSSPCPSRRSRVVSPEVNAGARREELHQYVVYETQPRGPLRIKLDDPPANAYTPPSSLTVHLSKIPMPELRPQPVAPKGQHPAAGAVASRPRAFPVPRTGPPPPPPLRPASPPRNARFKSSSSKIQRGHSMIAPTPASPQQPTQQQQAAWRGSLWGRSRK